jgi:uncharacterized protein YaaW (UPF0174 family)
VVDGRLLAAIRGPVMLIALGALIQMDFTGGMTFRKTWPVLIIVYAVLKLGEALATRQNPQGGPVV